MSDWSKDFAARLRRQREEKYVSDAKALRDMETIQRGRREIWRFILDDLRKKCQELADEPGGTQVNFDDFQHQRIALTLTDTGYTIVGRIENSVVRFSGDHGFDEFYAVKLSSDVEIGYYVADKNGSAVTVDHISSRILGGLFNLTR